MEFTTADKVQSLVFGRKSSSKGSFREYEPGRYRVQANAKLVTVHWGSTGWEVGFRGFEAIDKDLATATRLVLWWGATQRELQ